jgi:Predicted metal binding domain
LLKPDGTQWTDRLPGGVFNASAHPATGHVFVCMRGIREFHTHPSHVNANWNNYRGQDGMSLVGILMQLAHAWRQVA